MSEVLTPYIPLSGFIEEVEESDVEVLHGSHAPLPGAGQVDWSIVREEIRLHRIKRGKIKDAELDADGVGGELTVLEESARVALEVLPRSPKGIATRATAAGWNVRARRSSAHKEAVLYAADSKNDTYSAGDLRWVAEDREYWVMVGKLPPMTFVLHYMTRPKGTGYVFGEAFDPISGRMVLRTAGEFDEWFDVFAPPAKPRAVKKTKTAKALDGEEWTG